MCFDGGVSGNYCHDLGEPCFVGALLQSPLRRDFEADGTYVVAIPLYRGLWYAGECGGVARLGVEEPGGRLMVFEVPA